MSSLSVNLDTVGVLRESGHGKEPDPAQAAIFAEMAGANGITVLLRRDRKYLRDRDLYILKNIVKTRFNVGIPPTEDIIERVVEVKPYSVTIVADQANSDTPAATVDFHTGTIDFGDISTRFKGVGVRVNYFIEPEVEAVKGAAKAGADGVVFTCQLYADAQTNSDAKAELDRIDRAAQAAIRQGITTIAGRGLNYNNIQPLVELGNIEEFIVGRSICTRALFFGFDRAVREMKQTLTNFHRSSTG
jgi:pyridoxine 5-phosphate synthase